MQSAERDEHPAGAVVVGEPIRTVGVGDVDLDDDEIGLVVSGQPLDVLVDDHRLVVRREVGGERGQAERRKERVLDGAPVRTGRFRQRGEDELDAKRARVRHDFAL